MQMSVQLLVLDALILGKLPLLPFDTSQINTPDEPLTPPRRDQEEKLPCPCRDQNSGCIRSRSLTYWLNCTAEVSDQAMSNS
jgi:hypothetical protein